MNLIAFILLILVPNLVFAQAQVFPTHVTLTEEAPSTYLTLRNTSNQSQTYKVDLVFFAMDKDGAMKKSPGKESELKDILKYSPKSVDLEPGEKQIVRVMATTFDSLSDGEKYIHIHFTPTPKNTNPDQKTKSSMSLQAKIAVAVPIVVRKGTAKQNAQLEKIKATTDRDDNLKVQFTLKNDSNFFLYGDLEITGVTTKDPITLDKVIGISSYLPERTVTKVFPAKDWKEKANGESIKKISVTLKSNTESATAFALNAEADITPESASKNKSHKKSNKQR